MPKFVIDLTNPMPGQIPDSITVRGRTLSGFSHLPPVEAVPLQRQIIESGNSCGCQAGSIVAAGLLSGYFALTLLLPLLRDKPITTSWWGALLVMFAGGLAGKAIGVIMAGRQMRSGIERFEARIQELELKDTRSITGSSTPTPA